MLNGNLDYTDYNSKPKGNVSFLADEKAISHMFSMNNSKRHSGKQMFSLHQRKWMKKEASVLEVSFYKMQMKLYMTIKSIVKYTPHPPHMKGIGEVFLYRDIIEWGSLLKWEDYYSCQNL